MIAKVATSNHHGASVQRSFKEGILLFSVLNFPVPYF